jgi:hypothetical protein
MRAFCGAKAGSSQENISISLSGTVCTSVSAYCWHCGLILDFFCSPLGTSQRPINPPAVIGYGTRMREADGD